MAWTLTDGSQWNYRQKISVNTNGIGLGGNVTAPQNIHIGNIATFIGGNNFWAKVSSTSGYIAVTSSDGSTVLDYAIKDWNYAAQDMCVDVEHTWQSGADTIIYLYYGYVSGGTYPKGASDFANTYDANARAVYCMKDDPDNGTVQDLTANNYDGAKAAAGHPAEAVGAAGRGQLGDGIDDSISVSSLMFPYSNNFTVEFWFQNNGDTSWAFAGAQAGGNAGIIFDFNLHLANNIGFVKINVYNLFYPWGADNNKHHLAFKQTPTGMHIWMDGAGVINNTNGASSLDPNTGFCLHARNISGSVGDWFKGLLDEFTVSNVARSDDWLMIRYQGVNRQDDWGTVGVNYLQADTAECSYIPESRGAGRGVLVAVGRGIA
ncbi:MAG: LamG domain-containing protein [Chloroflexi bacterium]|nr:LamG domain-containing protein [Chloroflexota bacterium]